MFGVTFWIEPQYWQNYQRGNATKLVYWNHKHIYKPWWGWRVRGAGVTGDEDYTIKSLYRIIRLIVKLRSPRCLRFVYFTRGLSADVTGFCFMWFPIANKMAPSLFLPEGVAWMLGDLRGLSRVIDKFRDWRARNVEQTQGRIYDRNGKCSSSGLMSSPVFQTRIWCNSRPRIPGINNAIRRS